MKGKVNTSIKDLKLVKERHEAIIDVAISLFQKKGFHQTTTREIAQHAGFSIGTLYEYIRKKEDVLLLVYDSIEQKVYSPLQALMKKGIYTKRKLITIIDTYFQLMDQVQEEVIILYQELKSVSDEMRYQILQKERDLVKMLSNVIKQVNEKQLTDEKIDLIANNILVQGHMWCFRRWNLHKQYTRTQFTNLQKELLQEQLFT